MDFNGLPEFVEKIERLERQIEAADELARIAQELNDFPNTNEICSEERSLWTNLREALGKFRASKPDFK